MKAEWFWMNIKMDKCGDDIWMVLDEYMNMNVDKCGDEIWMDLDEYEHRLV